MNKNVYCVNILISPPPTPVFPRYSENYTENQIGPPWFDNYTTVDDTEVFMKFSIVLWFLVENNIRQLMMTPTARRRVTIGFIETQIVKLLLKYYLIYVYIYI